MTVLKYLELYFKYLTGNISSQFGLLKDLLDLEMDENHIYGPIHANMDNMHQIKYLSI